MDAGTCDAVCQALDDVITLACSLAGPCRVPTLALLLLGRLPEVLLPLTPVRGSLCQVRGALQEMRRRLGGVAGSIPPPQSCLLPGLSLTLQQHRRLCLSQSGLQTQIEAIVVTAQDTREVRRQLDAQWGTLPLQSLKRILVVRTRPPLASLLEVVEGAGEQGEQCLQDSGEEDLCMADSRLPIDCVTLETDKASLQNFFHAWLGDGLSDSEHLQLVFPSSGEPALTIKCDLHEPILNVLQLPCFNYFTLHPEECVCKVTFPCDVRNSVLPLHQLNVKAVVKGDSLCQSLVFGTPMVAEPTSCWKTDWDELERNHHNFKALCHLLLERDCVLVAELQPQPRPRARSRGGTAPDRAVLPRGHFALLPAPNRTLLLRALATQELLLPTQALASSGSVQPQSREAVAKVLDSVEYLGCYNPLLHSAGLLGFLGEHSRESAAPRPQNKRKGPLDRDTPAAGRKCPPASEGRQERHAGRAGAKQDPTPFHYPSFLVELE